MEWWAVLLLLIGGLIAVFATGFPISFGFLLVGFVSTYLLTGTSGLEMLTQQIYSSLASFLLTPVPMFILMGELMFRTDLAADTLDVLDRWLRRLPGRLSLLAAVSGTLFAATSGSTMANTAMLGTILLPDMKKRGYSNFMAVGPIIGVGGLAMLIPPSALGVLLASIGQMSIGDVLIGGVIPGVLLGAMFCAFIVTYAYLRPESAPSYETEPKPFAELLFLTAKYVLPVGFIIFSVLGVILLGLATPTEAAALGALATLVVNLFYGKLKWRTLSEAVWGTVSLTAMVFMILAASKTFSCVLAFTNATDGMVELVKGSALHPLLIILIMQLIVVAMGALMDPISIMMITVPIFLPIIQTLGYDPVWFAVIMLINLEMGNMTPPFGMLLYVMQGVAKDVSFDEIVWACLPYMFLDIIMIGLIIVWPQLVLWLPRLTGG